MTRRTSYKIAALRLAILICLVGFCFGCMLAIYGGCQLYTRTERLDLDSSQKAEIANLKTRLTFLQNNDWALIIEQLPSLIQDELAAMNERIKQKKHREYERFEQPMLTEKERKLRKKP